MQTLDFEFLNPTVLLALVAIPLALAFFIWRGGVRAAAIRRIGSEQVIETLLAQISRFRRRLKALLWLITFAALIVALARPIWGFESQVVLVPDLDVVFAVDASLSMNAEDIAPSRLERAKLDMKDFIRRISETEMGIVLFARNAFPYMPLTNSLSGARIFIDDISSDAITYQGTNVQAAIEQSLEIFRQRASGQGVIILISDGENLEDDPSEIVEQAAEDGVVIHTIGYGTPEGALIPLFDETGNLIDYKLDAGGDLVITRLEEDMMQQIAAITGGIYIPVKSGEDVNLSPIVAAINTLREENPSEAIQRNPVEHFSIFVALALLALSLEIIIPEARR